MQYGVNLEQRMVELKIGKNSTFESSRKMGNIGIRFLFGHSEAILPLKETLCIGNSITMIELLISS